MAEKIIALLFEQKNKCIAEDQAFLIDFLIRTHNAYNVVKINEADFLRASSARRSCVNAVVGEGGTKDEKPLPQVTADNAGKAIREVSPPTAERPEGMAFVAVGPFDRAKKSFRNFDVPATAARDDGSIVAGTVIKAFWAVYLRSNTSDTTENANPKLGVLAESSCARVERSMPNVRGQTWALVSPVQCPAKPGS